ncbi:Eukaryotic DNA topoisomerase I, catalytic core [compost metagenome]
MIAITDLMNSSCLVFVDSAKSGIYRKGKPGHFYYIDKDGHRITDEGELKRISALVIPPAWTEVWISPKRNGHLQATGRDTTGRKQYRYHPEWIFRRSADKYSGLLAFGKALPKARKKIASHLKRRKFDEKKVLALCTAVLQQTLIRPGHESYKNAYGSYGLTTLKNNHFKQGAEGARLTFVGKKGIKQDVALNDKMLVRLIKRCKAIPGQELFQYYLNNGSHQAVDSGMLNNYIREITGNAFTAKDFRTWGGTLEALRQLAHLSSAHPDMPRQKIILTALESVASMLGNTREVCRKSYVDPR